MQKIKIEFEYAYGCDFRLGGIEDEEVIQELENGETTIRDIISEYKYVEGISGSGMLENTANNIKVFIDDKQVEEFSSFKFPGAGWSVYFPQDEEIIKGIGEIVEEKNCFFSFEFELPDDEKFSMERVYLVGVSLDEVGGSNSLIVQYMLYFSDKLLDNIIIETEEELIDVLPELEELLENKKDNWDKIVPLVLKELYEEWEIEGWLLKYDEYSGWELGDDFYNAIFIEINQENDGKIINELYVTD